MDVISRPRSHGKTFELIHLLTTNEKYILLIHTYSERDRIIQDYHLDRATADRILCFNNDRIRERLAGLSWDMEILVDDVDLLLRQMFGQEPRVITVTGRNFDDVGKDETTEDSGHGAVRSGECCRDT